MYIMNSEIIEEKNTNRGTGAGGANTNASGLKYEKDTTIEETPKGFVQLNKSLLKKFMIARNEYNPNNIPVAHGCKEPDEAYVSVDKKKIYIIEKKFQTVSGSVCEKIQTAVFKKFHYNELYPLYDVIYVYCLSDWFKENCKAELQYLQKNNIPIFWGNSDNYKTYIFDYISNSN